MAAASLPDWENLDDDSCYVYEALLATRKAKLGEESRNWYDAAGNRKPDIPKKKPVCPRLASGFGCSCSPGGKAQVS